MSPGLLAARTLRAQWRLGALTVLCFAVSASVIVGALAVGDSVRAALRHRIVDPLGGVRHALVSPGPIGADRAAPKVSAALRLTGSASNQSETTVGGVLAWGVDARMADLVPGAPREVADGEAWITPALARDLGLGVGDPLFLALPKLAQAPTLAAFARRTPFETTVEVVATVAGVLPDAGAARFSLEPTFRPARSVFLGRTWLAGQMGRGDAANVFLGSGEHLVEGLGIEDDGLQLAEAKQAGGWVLQSDRLVLRDEQIEAAKAAALELGVRASEVSIALATTVSVENRSSAYAVAAWIRGVEPALNQWAAEDLRAETGARARCEFLVANADGSYGTVRAGTGVGRILPMSGLAAEPAFVPAVQGITDASRMDRWDPPFPIDRSRITPRDEAYWDRYRAAPRLFLTEAELRAAWGSSDFVTGVWLSGGSRPALEAAIARRVLAGATRRWHVDVRNRAIEAAQGSTNMAALVLALGFFVLAGALGLAATVFGLAVREEGRTHALLAAAGVPRRAILATVWLQGGALALLGSLVGVAGGVGFAASALAAMRSLMPADLGFDAIGLSVSAGSLLGGVALAAAFALASLARGVRAAGRGAVVPLLRGGGESEGPRRIGQGAWIWLAAGVAALAAAWAQAPPARGLLLGAGVLCVLVAALARAVGRAPKAGTGLDRRRLLFRQVQECAPSVMLGGALSALATFVLAAVAGQIRLPGAEDRRLLVTTSVPVRIDFSEEEGRRRLGFRPEELEASRGMGVAAFLRSPGDDASCLNPAKPVRPRFLGVEASTLEASPFRTEPPDAWPALKAAVPPGGPVPALADRDTLEWTLQSGVGGTVPFGAGQARFAGVIEQSPLAREILVPAESFRQAFPGVDGPSVFLVTPSPGRERDVARALGRALGPLGAEVRGVAEELAALRGVQNAYMAIFLALGALGLALSVVGSAYVALREAAARRSRFALLRAVGFGRDQVAFLAVAPGLAAALFGVLAGAGACAIGAPGGFALGPVGLVVGCVLAVLLLASLAIATRWRKERLVEALRSE